MIQAVAQDVEERFGDSLDDRLVRLRRGAFDDQSRGFSQRAGHFAHEARKSLEGMLQRQDPQAEHRLLQLADQAVEMEMLVLEGDRKVPWIGLVLRTLCRMADGVLGDQQFARDPRRVIRRQERGDRGDIAGLASSTERSRAASSAAISAARSPCFSSS